MSRNRKPRKPVHPLVRRFLEDYRNRRLLPMVARCPGCGDGYLPGDSYHIGGQLYWPVMAWLRCPYCGAGQYVCAPFTACLNGRCKRVIHLHLGSRALQAAVAMAAL